MKSSFVYFVWSDAAEENVRQMHSLSPWGNLLQDERKKKQKPELNS